MLYGLPDETLAKLKEVFILSKVVKIAVLFGSRARGDFKDNSDIDIGLYIDGTLYSGFYDDVNISAGIYKTNILIVNEVVNKKLMENIKNDEVVIYRRSE
jgi:predicted nucleotidyltransferase